MYNIGDKYLFKGKSIHSGLSEKCTIIHVFQSDLVPSPAKVLQYYGPKAPKREYEASSFYRLVLQKTNGHNLIVKLGKDFNKLYSLQKI